MEIEWWYMGCGIVAHVLAAILIVRGLLDLEDIEKRYSHHEFAWACQDQINGLKRLAWGNIALGCVFIVLGLLWVIKALFF